MFCTGCGAELAEGALFCASCGSKVKTAVEPAEEPAQRAAVQPQPAGQGGGGVSRGPVVAIVFVVLAIVAVVGVALAINHQAKSGEEQRAQEAVEEAEREEAEKAEEADRKAAEEAERKAAEEAQRHANPSSVDGSTSAVTLKGKVVRENWPTSRTQMAWSAVGYFLELDEPVLVTYGNAFDTKPLTTKLTRIHIDSVEQFGGAADQQLDAQSDPTWESNVGSYVAVRGKLIANAHTLGDARFMDPQLVEVL